MKLTSVLLGILPLTNLATAAPDDIEAAAAKRVAKLTKQYQKAIHDTIKHRKTGCTPKTLLRRKEWGTLSKKERLSYINAVYCLASKPPLTPPSIIPGARSRYDDFVGAHIQQTDFVHNDGLFLGFHRTYVHLYEQALREECGYTGAQPYWDSSLSYADPRHSTVFDGSPWSMGGNGAYVPDRPPTVIPLPDGSNLITFPAATGGGCIESGPFTADKFTIHLGPTGLAPQGPLGGLGYNPRCITRDLSPQLSGNCRPSNVSAVLETQDLAEFNLVLDSGPVGIHGAGHFLMGVVAIDVFSAPNDPAFWLHHANVDRLWTIWQGLDLEGRIGQVWGTGTSLNVPPSPNVTLKSQINFGVLSGPKKLGEVVSSVDGDFCYIYE